MFKSVKGALFAALALLCVSIYAEKANAEPNCDGSEAYACIQADLTSAWAQDGLINVCWPHLLNNTSRENYNCVIFQETEWGPIVNRCYDHWMHPYRAPEIVSLNQVGYAINQTGGKPWTFFGDCQRGLGFWIGFVCVDTPPLQPGTMNFDQCTAVREIDRGLNPRVLRR